MPDIPSGRDNRHRSSRTVHAAPELPSYGPYSSAPAAISCWFQRHMPLACTAWRRFIDTDHGDGDRRDEDLRPAVDAMLAGRGVTSRYERRRLPRPWSVISVGRRTAGCLGVLTMVAGCSSNARLKRSAAGFWEPSSKTDRFPFFIALDPKDGALIDVEVGYGLNCRTWSGQFEGKRIRVENFGTIAIHDSSHATLEYGQGVPTELRKTGRDRFKTCE